jgi:hypothetical protein
MQIYDPLKTPPRPPAPVPGGSTATPEPEAEPETPPPPPFPTAVLPPTLRDFVAAVAATYRVPDALPAICAMAATSAAIGPGLELVSGPDQLRTPANLIFLGSADSGSGKSRVFKVAIDPILDYEAARLEAWRKPDGGGPRRDAKEIMLTREIEELKKRVKPELDDEQKEQLLGTIAYAKAPLDELKLIAPSRLIVQDATIESLGVRLHQCGETLFSACADARKLADNLLGRNNPGKMADDSIYLQAFSGDSVIVDRQSRETLILRVPCLTLVWLVQPDIVDKLLAEAALQTGGFLARLLMCHTNAVPEEWSWETSPLTDELRQRWAGFLGDLLRAYHGSQTRQELRVPQAVWERFRDFHNPLVGRVRGELADVKSYVMRWTEQSMRLSLVRHAALWGREAHQHELSVETAEAAITLVQWFGDQQLEVLGRGRQEGYQKLVDRVLELLAERQTRNQVDFVNVRFIQNRHVVRTAEEAQALLDRMVADGLLVVQEIHRSEGGHVQRLYRATVRPSIVRG